MFKLSGMLLFIVLFVTNFVYHLKNTQNIDNYIITGYSEHDQIEFTEQTQDLQKKLEELESLELEEK